ncbi:MAG: glycine betaine ABC transporter substrate-binding protein [Pseudomonadales bacterium]|jgi:glycine betaine/proline transport system substrate-binding protein
MTIPIVIGEIDLSFHKGSAAVLAVLLEEAGHLTQRITAPHEKMFQMLAKGEVDIIVSAWLPASHDIYLNKVIAEVTRFAVVYSPYCIWGVPDYIPEEIIASVNDLNKPSVSARMSKKIQGIGPGAGISRFSRAMIDSYGLGAQGYEFHNGSLTDCTEYFSNAVSEKQWIVIPLWHPQFLHHKHDIRALQEPQGMLGATDDATLVMRSDRLYKLNSIGRQIMENFSLGNTAVTEIDYSICTQLLSPDDAAKNWLVSHSEDYQRLRGKAS